MIVRYKKLDKSAIAPKKNNPSDAGYDLNALNDCVIPSLPAAVGKYFINYLYNIFVPRLESEKIIMPVNLCTKIPTGIALEIPNGYFGQINDRSGLGSNSIKVFGGQVDSTYRGDVTVCLMNFSFHDKEIKKGDRIAQIMILPVASPELLESDELNESNRGTKGFGSSGLKEFHE